MSKISALVATIHLAISVLPCTAQLIQSNDLEYRGAFRLPEGSNGTDWDYSGYAMTYYPDGDPEGAVDGFPGSIFAIGHDHHQYVSEISIPVPVISPAKDISTLNPATTLQDFHDIKGDFFGYLEIPRAGLEYLPAQGSQTTGKLHFCWGQHFQGSEVSHGWCELDLSNPQIAGAWHFGGYTNYVTNDYIFEIPKTWADAHSPGQLLAAGRFRDGHWGGQGPTLFAYGPWNEGNPPAPGDTLKSITPLILYGVQEPGMIEITISDSQKMDNFKEADEWAGGAWLTAGSNSAVIFVGTKATGDCWYGFANGVVWPTEIDENTIYPEVPDWPYDDRGWWSEDIKAQIIFYDPAHLAAVANGTVQTWEPQPYAALDIDHYLFNPGFDLERGNRYLVGAVSFDRARGFLYVIERLADEDKSLVHVWKVTTGTTGVETENKLPLFELAHSYPNPFNPVTTIQYTLPVSEQVLFAIYDVLGREVEILVNGYQDAGSYSFQWNAHDVSSGVYFFRIQAGRYVQTIKMMVMR